MGKIKKLFTSNSKRRRERMVDEDSVEETLFSRITLGHTKLNSSLHLYLWKT